MLDPRLYPFIYLGAVVMTIIGCAVVIDSVITPDPIIYHSNQVPAYFISLNQDNSFSVFQGDKNSFSGTYVINNRKLFLNTEFFTFTLDLNDNNTELVDGDGGVWTRTNK
jgi:hypothetical protein